MATDAVLLLVLGRSMQDDDDDTNEMMESDLNDKIDCHVKLVPNYKK